MRQADWATFYQLAFRLDLDDGDDDGDADDVDDYEDRLYNIVYMLSACLCRKVFLDE